MSTFLPQSTSPSRQYIVVHESEGVTTQYLYLPDTMKSWPWPRRINPHHEAATAACTAWFKGFKPFSPKSLQAYDRADCGLLSALTSSSVSASTEHLRIAIDMMTVMFVVEASTDVESEAEACQTVEIAIDALRHPDKPRPEGEFILGEVTRQFWVRAQAIADPQTAERFIGVFIDYLQAVVVQAGDHDNRTELSIEQYLTRRRDDTACLGVLHLSIPYDAFHHPVIEELENAICDLISGDIVSYNKEQATGDDMSNILTVAMRHFRIDFDSAMEWATGYHKDVQSRFLNNFARVPSFGPKVDGAVQEYIAHLSNWPRANICWSFECGRYFGTKGLQIQETRTVPLFSNRVRNMELRRALVEIPLVEELERAFGGANENVLIGSIGGQE
ncbi:hypothetical protein V8D89_008291 [Ganoderma adspersum]